MLFTLLTHYNFQQSVVHLLLSTTPTCFRMLISCFYFHVSVRLPPFYMIFPFAVPLQEICILLRLHWEIFIFSVHFQRWLRFGQSLGQSPIGFWTSKKLTCEVGKAELTTWNHQGRFLVTLCTALRCGEELPWFGKNVASALVRTQDKIVRDLTILLWVLGRFKVNIL